MLRDMKYFSPSSFMLYSSNRDEFAQKYLIDPRPPAFEQTKHMALGSGFDAFVKNELVRCVFGASEVMPGKEYHLETLFNAQVHDEDWRAWVWEQSGWLFLVYKDSGAFDTLLEQLEGCESSVNFEVRLSKTIDLLGVEVPLLGFPDCYYINRCGILVILDWKCTGYMTKLRASPLKYYVKEYTIKDGGVTTRHHKKITPVNNLGNLIQYEHCFSETQDKWATQICIYGWMLGIEVGEPIVAQIEQLICEPLVEDKPMARIVTYCGEIRKPFQYELANKLGTAWTRLQDGDVFDSISGKQAQDKLKKLQRYNMLIGDDNPLSSIIKGA